MRICLLGDAWSIHTKRWARFFVDRGHEVHIISKGDFDDSPMPSVDLHIIEKANEKQGMISEIRNYRHLSSQVRNVIGEIRPDVINAHYISVYGVLAASSGFHPYVATVWGSDVLKDIKKSFQVRISIKRALDRADKITFAADHLRDHLINNLGVPRSKMVKIPWGVDLSIFHRGYDEDVRNMREHLDIDPNYHVVLSNRSMHPIYNVEGIVDSVPNVLSSRDDVTFVFIQGAGEDEYTAQIRSKIVKMGVEDNVRIIPRMLSPREMAILENMSDASISIPNSDQFGLTILEAMACGPVPIVSGLPSYDQYLEDGKNALFVDHSDPQSIAEAVLRAISDDEMRDRFFDMNLEIVKENENWKSNAIRMESLFYELIS